MGRKYIERLVGKIRSMQLVVPVAVAHLYHIQHALAQRREDQEWLFPEFHCGIVNWKKLSDRMTARPTHLA